MAPLALHRGIPRAGVQRGHAVGCRYASAASAAGRSAGCRGITALQVHQRTVCPLTRCDDQYGLQQPALYHRGRVASRAGDAPAVLSAGAASS